MLVIGIHPLEERWLDPFARLCERSGRTMLMGSLRTRPYRPDDPAVRVVAADASGEVVASGILRDVAFLARPETDVAIYVFVDPECRRAGIGAALLAHLEKAARAGGSRNAHTITYADLPEALAFAQRRGYREWGRKAQWSVDLEALDTRRFGCPEAAASEQGVDLLTYAQLREREPRSALDELYAAHQQILVELGGGLSPELRSPEAYRDGFVERYVVPEASVIARRGADVVGAALIVDRGGGHAHAHVSGVVGRGRGLKLGLPMKLKVMNELRRLRFRRLSLLYDADNAAARLTNRLLGFRPERTQVVLRKRLPRSAEAR